MKGDVTRDGRAAGAHAALTVLAIFTVMLLTGYAVLALPAPSRTPSLSIRVTPRSPNGTVHRGQATSYRVTVTKSDDFSGPLTLTFSGLPTGTSGTFVSRNQPPPTVTPSNRSTSLIVETTRSATLGRHALAITVTSGDLSDRTTAPLRILRHRRALSITASPSSLTRAAGASAIYGVCVTRTRGTRPLTLKIGSILPGGAVWAFNPDILAKGCSTLTLTTAATTPAGTYLFVIEAWGRRYPRATTATLTVTPPVSPHPTEHDEPNPTSPPPAGSFTISGDSIQTLYPGGAPSPINLSFHNPGSSTIFVTHVTVSVNGTSAGPGCPAAVFTTDDFSYGTSGPASGSGGVQVPPGQTVSLQGAGIDPGYWPTVAMLDSGDQDACQAATVYLAYTNGQAYSP